MNSIKESNVKYRTYYFFDDINIKNIDLNRIKIKSHANIFLFTALNM